MGRPVAGPVVGRACLTRRGRVPGTHERGARDVPTHEEMENSLIVLGVILLIIGFIAKVAIIWTLGIIAVVVGAILALLGVAGHAVGGRRHYF